MFQFFLLEANKNFNKSINVFNNLKVQALLIEVFIDKIFYPKKD